MLSKTFKSAKELKISQAKYDALVKVYWLLVDEVIPERLFNMSTIGSPALKKEKPCGTAGCILGWCHAVDSTAFSKYSDSWSNDYRWTGLHDLFYSSCAIDRCETPSPAQAAQAIHNFLTTGRADWRGVLKGA